jgi:hypothetical protein
VTDLENPPGFVVRTLAEKAAWDRGFSQPIGQRNGWLGWASTTAPGEVWIAAEAAEGPWYLSVTHPGVAAEMATVQAAAPLTGPGAGTFTFATDGPLTDAIDRAYKLALSLPDAPLNSFEALTAGLPRTTEAERLVIQRIGQDQFRKALLDYWDGRCPLTGISDAALLRASHIVPWAECANDAQRLDVHNGLLLSALWDAAFDAGLVSFTDDGRPLASPILGATATAELRLNKVSAIAGLRREHWANLSWHRSRHGFD